ncbi:hypothetical protein KUTeg_001222, partial [Tegillarca granosa]
MNKPIIKYEIYKEYDYYTIFNTSLTSGKASKYAGGNPVCPRPTPEWQKGIGSFFQSPNKGKENSEPTPLADEEESEPGCSSSSQNSEMEAGGPVPYCYVGPVFYCYIGPVPYCYVGPVSYCYIGPVPYCYIGPVSYCYIGPVPYCYIGPVSYCYIGPVPYCYIGPVPYCYIGPVSYFYIGPVSYCYIGPVPYCYIGPVPYCYIGPVSYCYIGPVPYCYIGPVPYSSSQTEDPTGPNYYLWYLNKRGRCKLPNELVAKVITMSKGCPLIVDVMACVVSINQSAIVAQLNDSHSQMIVHWAGIGSDVIIALAKDPHPRSTSSSQLFISFNYGRNFSNQNSIMYRDYPNFTPYIFADVVHNLIFTTTDYGKTFKSHRVPFRPKTIAIHPNKPYIVTTFALPTSSALFVSEFWRELESTAVWKSVSNNYYLSLDGLSVHSKDSFHSVLIRLAGVCPVHLFGSRDNGTLQFWVSYKRGRFMNAEFSHNAPRMDFFVADASEDQIFLCVNHNRTSSHLFFTEESFADIHKVDGLRGVYIASQFINSSFSAENQRSLITFDKGGEWQLVRAPRYDQNGKSTNCSITTGTTHKPE